MPNFFFFRSFFLCFLLFRVDRIVVFLFVSNTTQNKQKINPRRAHGKVGLHVMQIIKQELDPKGICNPGKLLPIIADPAKSDEENEAAQKAAMMFYKMGVMEHVASTQAAVGAASARRTKAKL